MKNLLVGTLPDSWRFLINASHPPNNVIILDPSAASFAITRMLHHIYIALYILAVEQVKTLHPCSAAELRLDKAAMCSSPILGLSATNFVASFTTKLADAVDLLEPARQSTAGKLAWDLE